MLRTCLVAMTTALATLTFAGPVARAAEQTASATTAALLPKDPANLYGQFDNGMKYIIRKNINPPGKVALNLHVRTGAINESDTQNGLAHFMEHMAFNGSKNYAPGKLIPLLNHYGMVFGADTNAHTNLWETVYKLTMPDSKPETLDTALTIFADDAAGLLITPTEIDSERRVILEEMRAGRSAAERMQKSLMKQIFVGTRLEKHDVIGDEEQIKHFPQSEFQDYWNTWYRPENMTLIVAGDIDPQQMLEMAKKKLGTIEAHGPSRQAQKAGIKPLDSQKVVILTDPEQVGADVSLFGMQNGRPPVTTVDQYRRETVEGISEWIVNRRFDEIVHKGGAPFRDANVDTSDFLNEGLEVNISAEGEPADWNKILDAAIVEVSRAIDHGFTKHELDLCKAAMLSGAQRAVDTESSRESNGIAAMLAGAVGRDRPILSAQQRLDLMKQIFADLTTDELHKAFTENFKTKNYAYVLFLPANKSGFQIPTNDDVLAAANAAWAKKPAALEETKLAGSVLASEPDPGQVVSSETDKDLDLTTVTFANGVVMHHKFNDYKKDSVSIAISLPGGSLEENADNHGISQLASQMLANQATSRFTSTQLRDIKSDKTVGVGGAIGVDALSLAISGNNKDLPFGLQLTYALLTDATLEQSAVDEWKKRTLQRLEAMPKTPQGQLQMMSARVLMGGDIRYAPLTPEQVNKLERSAAEAWFKRIVSNSAMEVTVVGDIKKDDAVKLIARYLGSLPKRNNEFNALDQYRKLERGKGPFADTVKFDSVTPKAIVMAGFVSCDENDPDRRPLSLAAQILSDRMIDQIREKDQLVYSIGCNNQPGRGMPGTGMMISGAPTDPQNADKLGEEIQRMLKEFADKGPTEDELATAKKQFANEMSEQMKQPAFWLSQIHELQYRHRSLADLKSLPGVYQTFTVAQVHEAFKKYYKDDSLIRLQAVPQNAPTTAPAGQAASPTTKPTAASRNDPRTGTP